MAAYLAMRIEGGHLDYSIVYRKNYRQFKEIVDEMIDRKRKKMEELQWH